jgi:hypothetical protein
VLVAFYQGDPNAGGVEIGDTNLVGVLAAGATMSVSIPWTVPATTNTLPIYAVIDPEQEFLDSDLLNNEVNNTFVESDLTVQSVTWSQITSNLLSITATVINQGTIASQPATVSFVLNSLTGTNLFSTNIVSLAPGQSVDVNFIWTVPSLGNGLNLYAVVNNGTNADFSSTDKALQMAIQPNITQVNVQMGPVLPLSDREVQVAVSGLAGQTYSIQVSTNLINWDLLTNLTLPSVTGQFIDSAATNYPYRFYRAVPWSANTNSGNSSVTNVVFSDNFNGNSIDTDKWTISGNTVTQTNQTMEVLTTVTDEPGTLTSTPFAITNSGLITITRQVFLHHDDSIYYLGNNHFFTGLFTINISNVPPFSVEYCDYDYTGSGTQPTYGFFIVKNGWNADSVNQTNVSPGIPAIWDTWFNEKVTYDPSSGQVQYFINNTLEITYNVGIMPVSASPNMSLYFQAYGWWTGHEQLFQNLVVSQVQ